MTELFATLRIATLACSAALLLVMLLRRAVRQYFRPQLGYALWLFVPVALLAALSPAPVRIVSMPSASVEIIPGPQAPIASTLQSIRTTTILLDPNSYLFGAWSIGAVLTWLMFLRQQRIFVRSLGRLSAIGGIIMRAETVVGSPALVGTFRPRIVVPLDFELRYNPREQELILAHERHHRVCGDAQINAFCVWLRCVFWFNPLMHIAAHYFRIDQELACDAAVIASARGARRSYASAMLKTQLAPAGLPMGCYWSRGNALKERIAWLQQPGVGRERKTFGAIAIFVLMGVVTYAAWAAQPPTILLRYTDASGTIPSDHPHAAVAPLPVSHHPLPGNTATKAISVLARRTRTAVRPGDASPEITQSSPAEFTKTTRSTTNFRQTENPAQARDEAAGATTRTTQPAAPPQARDENVDLGSTDRAAQENPSYRQTSPPPYPPQAIREHIEGRVVLNVRVDEHGTPTGAQVASVSPATAAILAGSSIAAVMQWRFNPAMREGRPVAGMAVVPFNFAIPDASEGAHPAAAMVYADTTQMQPASYRSLTGITYPPEQARAGVQGLVQIKLRIAADGSVSSASVDRLEPASAQALADAALTSARTWTFHPAHVAGRDIATTVTVPVVFALHSGTRPAGQNGNPNGALSPIVVIADG